MPAITLANDAEWHSVRESHVGGSEVASLFYEWRMPDGSSEVRHLFEPTPDEGQLVGCCSPFKTGHRLWAEKSGRVAPEDLGEVERIQAGIHLEPAIADWAKAKFGWKLRKVRRYLTHPHIPGWGSSLDYEAQEPGRPPVEIKNVDGGAFRRDWACDGKDIVGLPLNYALQVQAQIGVAEASHGWVLACIGGNELRRGRVERHEPTQEKLAVAITAFWLAIDNGLEPVAYADYESVAALHRYADKAAPAVEIEDDGFDRLCRQYLRWKRHAERVDSHLTNLKGRVASRIGDATRALSSGHKLTWPVVNTPAKAIPARWQEERTYRGALTVTPKENA